MSTSLSHSQPIEFKQPTQRVKRSNNNNNNNDNNNNDNDKKKKRRKKLKDHNNDTSKQAVDDKDNGVSSSQPLPNTDILYDDNSPVIHNNNNNTSDTTQKQHDIFELSNDSASTSSSKHINRYLNPVSTNVYNPHYTGFGKRHRIHTQERRKFKHNTTAWIRSHGLMSNVLPRLLDIIDDSIVTYKIGRLCKLCVTLLNAYKLDVDIIFRTTVYCLRYALIRKQNHDNNNNNTDCDNYNDLLNDSNLHLLSRFYRKFILLNTSNRLYVVYSYGCLLYEHKQYTNCYNYLNSKIEEGNPYNDCSIICWLAAYSAYNVCVDNAELYDTLQEQQDELDDDEFMMNESVNYDNNNDYHTTSALVRSDSEVSSIYSNNTDNDSDIDYSRFDDPDAYAEYMSQRMSQRRNNRLSQQQQQQLSTPPSPVISQRSISASSSNSSVDVSHPYANRLSQISSNNVIEYSQNTAATTAQSTVNSITIDSIIQKIQMYRPAAITLFNRALLNDQSYNDICITYIIKCYFDFTYILPHADTVNYQSIIHVVTQYRLANIYESSAWYNELITYQNIDINEQMYQQAYIAINLIRLDSSNILAYNTIYYLYQQGIINNRYMLETLIYYINTNDNTININSGVWHQIEQCISNLLENDCIDDILVDLYVPIKNNNTDTDNDSDTTEKMIKNDKVKQQQHDDQTQFAEDNNTESRQHINLNTSDNVEYWLCLLRNTIEHWMYNDRILLSIQHQSVYTLFQQYIDMLEQKLTDNNIST